jgi:hypothetical protein
MKIDWSKWVFVARRDSTGFWVSDGCVENHTDNIFIPISFKEQDKNIDTDNIDKWIKEQCKNEIRKYHIDKRLKELKDQQIPIEDNLDLIENEVERRGIDLKEIE